MKRILGIMILCLIPVMAFAEAPQEGFSYHGYARGGVAGNAQGEAVAGGGHFTVDGAFNNSRLANEGNYSEHLLKYVGVGENMWWAMNTRFALTFDNAAIGWNGLDMPGNGFVLPEAYLQLGWNDSDLVVWAGNRYHDSIGLGQYDYYINDMSNAHGVGVDGISMGSYGNLSLAYMMGYSDTENGVDTDGNPVYDRDGTIHSFVARPHFNAGPGTLSFKIAPQVATSADGTNYGAILEASYNMNSFFGFAEGNTEFFGYYDFGTGVGNFEWSDADTDAYRTGAGFQSGATLTDALSLKATVMTEARGNQNVAKDGIWNTAAIRPFYSFTNNFGMMMEYGFDHFMNFETEEHKFMNRVTLAPTMTLDTGSSVFSDPIIMFYMTYAYGDIAGEDVLIDGYDEHGIKYGVMFQVGW